MRVFACRCGRACTSSNPQPSQSRSCMRAVCAHGDSAFSSLMRPTCQAVKSLTRKSKPNVDSKCRFRGVGCMPSRHPSTVPPGRKQPIRHYCPLRPALILSPAPRRRYILYCAVQPTLSGPAWEPPSARQSASQSPDCRSQGALPACARSVFRLPAATSRIRRTADQHNCTPPAMANRRNGKRRRGGLPLSRLKRDGTPPTTQPSSPGPSGPIFRVLRRAATASSARHWRASVIVASVSANVASKSFFRGVGAHAARREDRVAM